MSILAKSDPHCDSSSDLLDYCQHVTCFISSWAWACSQSDEGANLSQAPLEGLAMLAATLGELMQEHDAHLRKRCTCFTADV